MFPLIGEPLALDLVNTCPHTPDGPVDLLATRAGLAAWLDAEAERLPSPPTHLSDVEVGRVVALRDHLATAIEHARRSQRPPQSSLNALTDAQKAAPAWQLLRWEGQAVTATPQRTGDAADRLLADLAYAATDLLTDRRVTSIRRCAGRLHDPVPPRQPSPAMVLTNPLWQPRPGGSVLPTAQQTRTVNSGNERKLPRSALAELVAESGRGAA